MITYAKTKVSTVFSNQISITSESGVGGSTLYNNLKVALADLPYRFVSGGSNMRSIGDGLGMKIEQFAAYNREHPEKGYDMQCDHMFLAFGLHNFVVAEGRMAHAFMPGAFHVRLVCDPEVRAQRRWADQAKQKDKEKKKKSKATILGEILQRDEDDNIRYRELYPGCLWLPRDYDLNIDTDVVDKEEMPAYLLREHKEWLNAYYGSGVDVVTGVMVDAE